MTFRTYEKAQPEFVASALEDLIKYLVKQLRKQKTFNGDALQKLTALVNSYSRVLLTPTSDPAVEDYEAMEAEAYAEMDRREKQAALNAADDDAEEASLSDEEVKRHLASI